MVNFDDICTQLWAYFHSAESPIDYPTFYNLETDQRVKFMSKLIQDFNFLSSFNTNDKLYIKNKLKSTEKSSKLRLKAVKLSESNPHKALMLYTRSIAVAPTTNQETYEDLAIGYASRGELYFSLGNYKACLNDINRALMLQTPGRKRFEQYRMKSKCCKEMGNLKEAVENILLALEELANDTSITLDETNSHTNELMTYLEEVGATAQDPYFEPADVKECNCGKKFGDNPEAPALSSMVAIQHCTEFGRYIVATTDIYPGDVLSAEAPFASVLLPDHYRTHCFHCLKQHDALIPCKHCDLAMFCSEECRARAWDSSHKIECQILPLLNDLHLGNSAVWHLALRVITSSSIYYTGPRGLQTYVKTVEEMNRTRLPPNEMTNQRTKGFDEKYQYSSIDLRTVHFLERNIGKQNSYHLFKYAVKAACILKCLEESCDFFDDSDDDLKGFIGGLLARYIMALSCGNAAVILDLVAYKDALEKPSLEVGFGVGVYPALCLFNHSCDANAISRFERGDKHVLVATRPITCGEQITINYGPSYPSELTREDRNDLLEEFLFNCQCPPCTENWPTKPYLQQLNSEPIFVCWNCGCHLQMLPEPELNMCTICNTQHKSVLFLQGKSNLILLKCKHMRDELTLGNISVTEAMNEMTELVTTMSKMVARPNTSLYEGEDIFKEIIMRQGNFFVY